ncbi:hypothetical protein OOK60_03720 [Trichothermofontia sichuanensis B231]|uniref:hypothetical protein n=1 Tax=Trichothermofontia sichuanensis TaxID=3045816 RepID=UPI002245898D|nr:hypothetical protein OOK60_03720 [Trichothermofontia sichuanensis B231]
MTAIPASMTLARVPLAVPTLAETRPPSPRGITLTPIASQYNRQALVKHRESCYNLTKNGDTDQKGYDG